LLYGGQAFYGILEGDSALVPTSIQSSYKEAGITEMRFITIGPGIGYAYTLVMDKHFYIMGSLIGSVNLNISTEEAPAGDNKKTSVSSSAIYKAGIGWNSDNWSFGATVLGDARLVKGAASSKDYYWQAGNFRVQVAKKFELHPKKK
jgi:hypothetical protein